MWQMLERLCKGRHVIIRTTEGTLGAKPCLTSRVSRIVGMQFSKSTLASPIQGRILLQNVTLECCNIYF